MIIVQSSNCRDYIIKVNAFLIIFYILNLSNISINVRKDGSDL